MNVPDPGGMARWARALGRAASERRKRWRVTVRGAAVYRHALRRVAFVGVTGTVGKSTTVRLVAEVLAARYRGRTAPNGGNTRYIVARTVLATSPWDDFAVQEIATARPGDLDLPLRLTRPRIAVVLNVGADHLEHHATLESIAAEKSKLVKAVPPGGAAVLNADDPRVLAMAGLCAGRVLTFGTGPDAELRALDVDAAWPSRLSFTAEHRGRRVRVRTRLIGEHWLQGALAALGTGLVLDVPLEEGAARLEGVEPSPFRMNAVELESGAIVVRDDYKASVASVWPALSFLRAARATRRILVLGTIDHWERSAEEDHAEVTRRAVESAEHVYLVRRAAQMAPPAAEGWARDHGVELRRFESVRELAQHLRTFLAAGDLVLLKGYNTADHLVRLLLDRTGGVGCWRSVCHRKEFCDSCPWLPIHASPDEPPPPPSP